MVSTKRIGCEMGFLGHRLGQIIYSSKSILVIRVGKIIKHSKCTPNSKTVFKSAFTQSTNSDKNWECRTSSHVCRSDMSDTGKIFRDKIGTHHHSTNIKLHCFCLILFSLLTVLCSKCFQSMCVNRPFLLLG